jgi:hypothetical protein
MMLQPADSLIESFLTPDGSYQPSTCQDVNQQAQIPFQRHVDLRTFMQDDLTTGATMYDLDLFSVSGLDSYTMMELDSDFTTVYEGEHWTEGTVGPQSDRQNQSGIQLTCTSGTTTTVSVSSPVDILTGFDNSAFVSLACPALPLGDLTLASCFIDLTSDPAGSFGGTIASVPFSDSLTSPVAGNSEIRLPRTSFTGIDLTNVTGVRLRIAATASCTFRCMAIRVFSATWKVAPVDLDTRRNMLKRTVTRDGSLNTSGPSVDFPTSTTPPSDETDFPILFRTLPGTSNPIDIRHTTFFYTGSMTQGTNTINMYYRATASSASTMADLDGTAMSVLDGNVQPDFSSSSMLLGPETVGGLDVDSMMTLDGRTMAQMDSRPVSNSEDYFEIEVTWGTSPASLTMQNKGGDFYSFAPTLNSDTYYVVFTELVGTSVRCIIYPSDGFGNIDFDTVVFDTTEIDDPALLHNRRGRIGWYAQLVDGDASLVSINSRYANYGEYLSTAMQSMTPVVGAQLFVESSPDVVEAAQVVDGPFGGSVTLQPNGFQVASVSSQPHSGAQTTPFWVYDWDNLVIEFDLLYPTGTSALQIFLLSDTHNIVPLPLPLINAGHWQHYRLQVATSLALPYQDRGDITGFYNLLFLQPGSHSNVWVINNLTVTARAFRWKMRSDGPDLWDDDGLDWVPFDFINGVYDGTVANTRGTSLQVSGVQMFPEAEINALQIIPKYASPGRFVWSDEALLDGEGPTAAFTVES